MAAHLFLPFWQAPGFAGRFFCSALCSGHIGVFHTAAGFIWGKRGGKCVKLQAAQHNRYKGVWLCKKRKAGRQRAFLFAFFMISVFACVRFFGNGRSGYSFRSRYSRSFCAESRRGQPGTAPFQWLPAAECPKYSQQRSDPVDHKGNHPRNQTLPQRQSGSPLAAQFPPHGGHCRYAGGVQQAEYQQRPGGQR